MRKVGFGLGESTESTLLTHLTIIMPIYNGAAHAAQSLHTVWDWLGTLDHETELLVVDDGSGDATPAILAAFAREVERSADAGQGNTPERRRFRMIRDDPNQGKGFAVRRGMLEACGRYRIFMDADLTYPIENTGGILDALESGADLAIASRTHADSRYVVAPNFFRYLYTRHVMGRFFNLLVRMFVVGGVGDTQAGLKGASRAAALDLFPRCRLTRFSFDVELLFVARRLGKRIDEVGVTFLYRKEPSTVRFFRDSVRMITDMARIRWRGFRKRYDRPTPVEAILGHPACAPSSSE